MDMININLLPKEFRKKTGTASIGKSGLYAMGATAGIIITIVVISLFQMFQLQELDEKMKVARIRTRQLQKDIAMVDALTDVKAKIMQRMAAVDKLDQHRVVWVRILEDVTRNLPEFSWFSLFEEVKAEDTQARSKKKRKGKAAANKEKVEEPKVLASVKALTRPVKIEGFSFTLNSLANFMINMMKSDFFSEIEMASVNEVQFQKQKAYNYKLTAVLHYLSDEELKKILETGSGPDLLASF